MEAKAWGLLDKTPEKHINELVVASCIVAPKESAKHRMIQGVLKGAVKGLVPGEGVGAELVKMGLEHGAEAAADKVWEHKEKGEVALPPHMYLVAGKSTLGLYAVTQRSLLYFLQGELLRVPHQQVAEFTIEQHLTTVGLTLRLQSGLALELECGRIDSKHLEKIEASIRQANPALPGGPLPQPGYGPTPPPLPSGPLPQPAYGMQFPAPAYPAPKTKEQWVQEGRAYIGAGRFQEALAAYEAALALDPTFGYAYFGRGEALRRLQRPEEALLAFERAIQLSPQDAAPYRRTGYVLNTLKRYAEALAALEQAIHLDPAYAGSYVGKGDALKGQERSEEALAAYDQALALDPRLVDAALGKAEALKALGQYAQALAAYDLALGVEPGNAAAAAGKSEVQWLLAQPASRASSSNIAPAPEAQPAQPSVAELPAAASQAVEATERISRPLSTGPKGVFTLLSGRRVALMGQEAIIGRGPLTGSSAVEVNLAGEQEQQTVSHHHACIRRIEAGFEIEDLGSTNQTLLNHEPLQPGCRYLLHHADVVEFGKVRCAFTME
ncbi:MAG TPA: tetratricopeptide repeat protein [Ktedonobacterales bacterium]|nr:tetratricopeptide repeat protein [Ktedonobacterales bacterium]